MGIDAIAAASSAGPVYRNQTRPDHAIEFPVRLGAASGRQSPPLTQSKACILVVDDEKVNFELLKDMLPETYHLIFASDGKAALDVASTRMPDVILLDAMMPGMNGFEVLNHLKADRSTSAIPVIFMTSLECSETEIKGLQYGASDYIKKSAPPALVRARIDNHLALKAAQDELARQATTDALTGVANRRQFDRVLHYEFAQHVRSGTEFSVIMLDIDHFKTFNDNFGHACGDVCLKRVARAIKEVTVRSTDLVARYGGEEFAILLPLTALEAAIALAQRMRRYIAKLTIRCDRSDAMRHVTASLGVAGSRHAPGRTAEHILADADAQMYLAKAAGRNQVFWAGKRIVRSADPVPAGD